MSDSAEGDELPESHRVAQAAQDRMRGGAAHDATARVTHAVGPTASVPVTFGPAGASLPSVAAAPPVVASGDDKTQVWTSHQKRDLAKRRRRRGKQVRKVQSASFCTGLGPEEEVWKHADIEFDSLFGIENKACAVQFLLMQRTLGCLFTDLRDVIDNAGGYCAKHGYGWCSFRQFYTKAMDMLVAGISCRPYSMARTGRRTNDVSEHRDHWMSEAFIAMLLNCQPALAVMEQVIGFIMRSRGLGDNRFTTDPLKAFIQRLDECGVLCMYSLKVFVVTGSGYLAQLRNRVYILFVHLRAGGNRAANRAERYIQDPALCTFEYI